MCFFLIFKTSVYWYTVYLELHTPPPQPLHPGTPTQTHILLIHTVTATERLNENPAAENSSLLYICNQAHPGMCDG